MIAVGVLIKVVRSNKDFLYHVAVMLNRIKLVVGLDEIFSKLFNGVRCMSFPLSSLVEMVRFSTRTHTNACKPATRFTKPPAMRTNR